jgi:N,N'-diacetylchitobiose transport system substrate-binding protein
MKKGLLAALAASTLVLTGCAAAETTPDASSSSTEVVTGDIRVWVNGGDTPQAARDYLKETFEAQNPGSTLTIEEQEWGGLVEKLTTAMSGNDSPDVVEIGNTWAPGFTSALAFTDLTGSFEELGGADLLPGFVEVGSYDGMFYAAPYYSGARLVFYSKSDYEAAGLSVPTTLEEYVSNAEALKAATGNSGVYFPGKDWYNSLPYIWENGGEVAVNSGGTWDSQLSSEASLKGLALVKRAMDTPR